MKIGTITFHWATNYGAVLQAFALQKYLKLNGYETEIINYIPFRVRLIQTIMNIKNLKIIDFVKEYKINKFRKQYLSLSKKTFHTNNSLVKEYHDYDVCICGSDQIWNESFVLYAESKPTLSYYLNFVGREKTRISYATSFGTDKLSSEVVNLIKPELAKFKNISVRENTGKTIIEDMGLNAELVVDPTLLLESKVYEELIDKENTKNHFQLFSYILHDNQITAEKISKYIFDNYFDKSVDKKYNMQPIGIYEWLYNARNSRLVLTNSFHGAIFSIIFKTPFIVIPVDGSRMNDRISTLLSSVGLQNRIINKFDASEIDRVMKDVIEWEQVDIKVQRLRKGSIEFLEKVLGEC
jgi:hypothetical protein